MIHSGAVVAAGISQGKTSTFKFDFGVSKCKCAKLLKLETLNTGQEAKAISLTIVKATFEHMSGDLFLWLIIDFYKTSNNIYCTYCFVRGRAYLYNTLMFSAQYNITLLHRY